MGAARLLISTWTGKAILAVVAIAFIGAVVVVPRLAASAPTSTLRTATVSRGNVIQSVSVSGSLNASAIWKVPFKVSGRLIDIPVKVGQAVTAGQVLAQLDPVDLQNALKQAQVNLLTAQAKYEQTIAGATAEDVAIAKNSVDSAQKSLQDTRRTTSKDVTTAEQTLAKMRSGYTGAQNSYQLLADGIKADVANLTPAIDSMRAVVATTISDFKSKSTSDITTAKTSLGAVDSGLVNAQTYANNQVSAALTDWVSARDNVISAWLQFDGTIQRGTDTSGATSNYQSAQLANSLAASRLVTALDPMLSAISSGQSSVVSAQAAMNTYNSQTDHELDVVRADLVGLQAALVTESSLGTTIKNKITQAATYLQTITDAIGGSYVSAQQALDTAKDKASQSVNSQENALHAAQLSFQKTTASPRQTDIAVAYASVQLAQLNLDKAQQDLDNATLRAPTAGVVATIANGVGEAPANPFATIAVVSSLILHGTVGESDISKLKMGQVATVSVDAAGTGQRLTGKVTGIDPVATISQGVPVYGVDVQIDLPDQAVRPGMSGSASVIVASQQGVLTLPNLAIRTASGQRSVQVMRNGQPEDAQVSFGISNDTVTEIRGGLAEGDTVAIPSRTPTATGRPGGGFPGPGGGQPVFVGR